MAGQPLRVPMSGRDPGQAHRTATPLELLFDLCFVVAVAQAASALHHGLAAGDTGHAIGNYLIVFFTIWWPWVNFTWFASAYDTDDVVYRLLAFVQMAGILVVTAGVSSVFAGLDFRTAVVGYVIMRIALVALWLRAAAEDPAGRPVALRFAIGISVVQLLWVARLAIGGPLGFAALLLLGAAELAIPVWAERSGRHTPWHPEHIAERYGLFTIIVLGECVLATSTAVTVSLDAGSLTLAVVAIALGGLVLVFGLWWAYFKHRSGLDGNVSFRAAFGFGYGHYVVFAAVAALGAGLQVATDSVLGQTELAAPLVAATDAVPVVVYLVAVAILHGWPRSLRRFGPITVACVMILAAAAAATWVAIPVTIVIMAFIVTTLVAINVVAMQRTGEASG
jgi:low temperature requirement protein LtrA